MKRADPVSLAAVKARLEKSLGPAQLKTDPDVLASYGHDESDTGDFPSELVALPRDTAEVVEVINACMASKVPVTPVGARTGKSGGSLPLDGGVSLSLERLNKILSVDAEDLTAVTQPGVITGALMRAVEDKGLFYPPDPNSWESCTIGGNVAENAGGPRALKYGVTRDYVIGLEWVTPRGEVLRVGRKTIKGVAGYDLVGLLVGSEGTLGVATEITVQLLPKPKKVMTALMIFPGVLQAAHAVSAVLAHGILPRCLELLDDVSIRAIDGRGFNFPAGTNSAVIIEVDGNSDDGLLSELAEASRIATEHGALDTLMAQDESQREKLWAARRVVSSALRAMKKFKISEDICVPRSKIPTAIEQLKALGQRVGLTLATYGHAGDGNLHANVLYDGPEQRPLVEKVLHEMMSLTVQLGGTITGEHGVGYAKRDFLPLEQAGPVIELQRQLKAVFDPVGLFNPGKIFPLRK